MFYNEITQLKFEQTTKQRAHSVYIKYNHIV